MSDIEKIQAAEAQVAEMQEALASLQSGLQRAEDVAVAAEEAKETTEVILKVVLGAVGLYVVVRVISGLRRRRRSGD